MSDAYLNLIKAARRAMCYLDNREELHEILGSAVEAAEKGLEPWQKEEINGDKGR